MNDSFSSVQNIRSGLERENGCNSQDFNQFDCLLLDNLNFDFRYIDRWISTSF
jgi:hypothetical protein